MPDISLPEEILQIIWRKVYTNNVVPKINIHQNTIDRDNIWVDYVYLDMDERKRFFALATPFSYQPSGVESINFSRINQTSFSYSS